MLDPIEPLCTGQPNLAAGVADFDPGEIGDPPRFGAFVAQLRQAVDTRGSMLKIRDFN